LRNLDKFADSNPSRAIDVVLVRAQLLDSLDRRLEALDHYDKILEYRPNDEFIALGRAELLLRMDRLDDSLQAYREAARVFPDSSMTLNALGYTLADRTDQYREAERLIRKALKYDPENPAIIDSFGWVLHKRGKYEAALEQLEVAYERFPDHEVAAHLVEVLVTLERIDEASELLVAAEEKTPDSELLKDVRERLLLKTP
jgi:tetratricopeptide (TPR) repeat protein